MVLFSVYFKAYGVTIAMNGKLRCGVSLNMNLKYSILLMNSHLPSWILFFPCKTTLSQFGEARI